MEANRIARWGLITSSINHYTGNVRGTPLGITLERPAQPHVLLNSACEHQHSPLPKEVSVMLWHDMWPEISVLLYLLGWAGVLGGFMLTH